MSEPFLSLPSRAVPCAPSLPAVVLGAPGALHGVMEQAAWAGERAEQTPGCGYCDTMGTSVPAVTCCAVEWLAHLQAQDLICFPFS